MASVTFDLGLMEKSRLKMYVTISLAIVLHTCKLLMICCAKIYACKPGCCLVM